MTTFKYKTIIIDNVYQSVRQALNEGEENTQEAGILFKQTMDQIGEEGWEIIAVTPIYHFDPVHGQTFMYTLKKLVTEA